MARGAVAKQSVEEKIISAFGADFAGIADKKIYVWADDGGERVQIAISLTCPKNPIGATSSEDGLNFSDNPVQQISNFKPAEITPEEIANVQKLLKELGF